MFIEVCAEVVPIITVATQLLASALSCADQAFGFEVWGFGNAPLGGLRWDFRNTKNPLNPNSFHFLFYYPIITTIFYSSSHFLFHYPIITPIYNSFHFLQLELGVGLW